MLIFATSFPAHRRYGQRESPSFRHHQRPRWLSGNRRRHFRQHAANTRRIATVGVMIRETKTAARCTNLPLITSPPASPSIQCFCSCHIAGAEFPSQPSALCDSPPSVQSLTICLQYAGNFRRPGRALRECYRSYLSDTLQTADTRWSATQEHFIVFTLCHQGSAILTSCHVGAHIRRDRVALSQTRWFRSRIGSMAITGLPDFFS